MFNLTFGSNVNEAIAAWNPSIHFQETFFGGVGAVENIT